jgi:hypothetical protein
MGKIEILSLSARKVFFFAQVKPCIGLARFSQFCSKMDDITGAEQL